MEYEPIPIISKQFPKIVIPLIDSAVSYIDIIVFDWRIYPKDPACAVSLFTSSVIRAVTRGVRVRVLVQNDGVVNYLKNLGVKAKKLNTKKILHTKLLMVDLKKVVIGSHNYTQHAFSSNEEASLFVNMGTEQHAFLEYFNNLYGI